jgi:hypothetical protein
MTFTKIIRPRRHTLRIVAAKPSLEPRPKGRVDRPILHLKAHTGD